MSFHRRKACAKQTLNESIRSAAPTFSHARQPYWRLITAVRASSRLLSPSDSGGRPDDYRSVIQACKRMAKHNGRWHRQPETWVAPDASAFVQFRSLVSHLFDQYQVPTWMAPIWRSEDCRSWEIEMYLHLAAGSSIRQFEWPLPYPVRMTKLAARWFMQTPGDLFSFAAYRWAHVRSLGGDDRLARILMVTPALMIPREQEVFWESVIRFLVENQPMTKSEIEAVVHFIDRQRFQPAETVWGRGAGQEPLQPEFSIRGRTLMSLRRHMTNWRLDMLEKLPLITTTRSGWTRTNISPFRQVEGDVIWTIDELLSDRELRVEGGIMKHCVATYIHDCARRRTSIWSMKIQQGQKRKRKLTIEVLPGSRTIWQAKGKCNAAPEGTAREMLQRWADQEGLKF